MLAFFVLYKIHQTYIITNKHHTKSSYPQKYSNSIFIYAHTFVDKALTLSFCSLVRKVQPTKIPNLTFTYTHTFVDVTECKIYKAKSLSKVKGQQNCFHYVAISTLASRPTHKMISWSYMNINSKNLQQIKQNAQL